MMKQRIDRHLKLFRPVMIFVIGLAFLDLTHSPAQGEYPSFAVVELFTSEGCSSCPPADQLLQKLTELSQTQNPQIFTLGFHVDYWDGLGWPDRFSNPSFTQRQRRYAQIQQSSTIYTPQMIINGQNAFGGYREDLALQSIGKFLQKSAQTQIQITLQNISEDTLEAVYDIAGNFKNAVLHCAIVEQGLTNRILRGENRGRTLKHANVVRTLTTIPLTASHGAVQLSLPKAFKKKHSTLIAYIQNSDDFHIIGATRVHLD